MYFLRTHIRDDLPQNGALHQNGAPNLRSRGAPFCGLWLYSGVRVLASRILHEILLLIGELAIRRTTFYEELIFQN